jgi:hypothetical protein
VKASDGTVVPIKGPGIRFHQGGTYTILSVGEQFLRLPGKVGAAPWNMEISAARLPRRQTEHYQYSVILDSALRMEPRLGQAPHRTGDRIFLTARLAEAGQPLIGARDVRVEVMAPAEGKGNWLARHPVSSAQLRRVPERRGTEVLSPFARKGIYLREIRKLVFPQPPPATVIPLYDDGTHGDLKPNDGVYSNQFTTSKEGVYSFRFRASGTTRKGNGFQRDRILQEHVSVKALPRLAGIELRRLGAGRVEILAKPQDALGNLLGPGHASRISLKSPAGRFAGPLQDALDGSYRQVLELPAAPPQRELAITVWIDGQSAVFTKPLPPR